MLNDKKREIIENNIGIVYDYIHKHNITDEDEQAECLCEFCNIIDSGKYDKNIAALSTFVWRSLDNYRKRKWRTKTTIKRTLLKDEVVVSLNTPLNNDNDKENNELMDIVPNNHDYFGEIELKDTIIELSKMIKDNAPKDNVQRKITQEQVFNNIIYAYLYKNGKLNGAELALKYNTSRQSVNQCLAKVRKVIEEYLEL